MPAPAPAPPTLAPTLAEAIGSIRPARPSGIAAVARLMLVGGLVLAVLGARPLREYMQRQEGTPARVQAVLDRWDVALTWIGVAALHPGARAAVERAKRIP